MNDTSKPQSRTAPTPGDWKLIDMPDTFDIASQENRNTFGVFARIDKNEIFPGQARANALCMVKAKAAIKLLRQLREGYTPLALQPEIDALLEDFKKEGIFI